jgi:hypothetical protein
MSTMRKPDNTDLIAAIRRYHPGATKKELLTALATVSEKKVREHLLNRIICACSAKHGEPDIPVLFDLLHDYFSAPQPPLFWELLEELLPVGTVPWLQMQLELRAASDRSGSNRQLN